MATPATRYRITVTPIEKDGVQCSGRCTIELEHRAHQDWMRLIEASPRLAGFSSDERAALLVAAQILRDVSRRHADEPEHPLTLQASALLTTLDALDSLQLSR